MRTTVPFRVSLTLNAAITRFARKYCRSRVIAPVIAVLSVVTAVASLIPSRRRLLAIDVLHELDAYSVRILDGESLERIVCARLAVFLQICVHGVSVEPGHSDGEVIDDAGRLYRIDRHQGFGKTMRMMPFGLSSLSTVKPNNFV